MTSPSRFPLGPGEDDHADILRTDTMRALLTALQGWNVFGVGAGEWAGSVLLDPNRIVNTSRWTTPEGRYRYDVEVTVTVRRTPED